MGRTVVAPPVRRDVGTAADIRGDGVRVLKVGAVVVMWVA